MVSARKGKAAAGGSRAASIQQPTASSSEPQQTADQPQSPAPAASSKDGTKTRQKRVLPTRLRRGGPGVGSCETDMMILETMRRKFESEPLIPATTPFLLTTKSALVPFPPPASASSSTAQADPHINTLAYSRYFDRPEVQEAYRAQQLIQTPEFTELSQDAHEAVDTSDAAYEKRHRKYETFEKRQRLREKEKLKHEHYKLKERIEQLRGMDTSAFLAIPTSDFAQTRNGTPAPSAETDTALDASNLHGAAAYHEGERRRKEMLEVALSLEQRYRTLLPPDRRWMEKKSSDKLPGNATSVDVSEDAEEVNMAEEREEEVETAEETGQEEEEDTEEEEEEDEEDEEEGEDVEDDGESEIDTEEIERHKSKQLKLRIKFPPRMLSSKSEPKPMPSRGGGKQITLSPFFKHSSGGKGPIVSSSLRSASYSASYPDNTSKYGRYSVDTADSLPSAPSAKRQRTGTSASSKSKTTRSFKGVDSRDSISTAGLAGKKEPTTCVLMVAAIRQSSAPTARKTQRHVTAFGARVPQDIEEVRDFEIPDWVLSPGSASEDGDRHEESYNISYNYG